MKKNIVTMFLAILIVALLTGAYMYEAQAQQARDAAFSEYEARTAAYREELNVLTLEMAALERGEAFYGGKANLIVAFAVTDNGDMEFIRENAALYGFPPVLVVDCTMDASDMEALLKKADRDWEVMLYIPGFADDTGSRLKSARNQLEKQGRTVSSAVFYRTKAVEEQELDALQEAGFSGLTMYHDAPVSGQFPNGMVYFDFSRITSGETSVEQRLAVCYERGASMVYVFDMESLRNGNVSQAEAAEMMEVLAAYSKKELCEFATVTQVADHLSEISGHTDRMEKEREQRAANIKQRMDELDRLIAEVYHECIDGVL